MKQIHNAGGKVIKGEKGIPIFFYGTHQKKDGPQELQSKADERRYRFARIWYVWNVSQCELPEGTLPPLQNPVGTAGHIEHVDDFCHNMGVEILHKPGGAFYSPARDMVVMPPLNTFHSTEQYYGTLLHELVHATGAKTRLNRESLLKYREQRPFEELVAELGSAMLCRELNISAEPREDNAAYIQSWCKEIRDKPNTILKAASAAGKAVDWLWNERNNTQEEKAVEHAD
jgi:antirestriction protein ArdC